MTETWDKATFNQRAALVAACVLVGIGLVVIFIGIGGDLGLWVGAACMGIGSTAYRGVQRRQMVDDLADEGSHGDKPWF